MEKMTYVDALNVALAVVTDEAVKEKLEALKVQLEKRKSATRKPSKAQVANEAVKNEILAQLTNEGKQCKDIAEAVGISGQKCSALLTQLVNAEAVQKYTEKRVTYFKAVEG